MNNWNEDHAKRLFAMLNTYPRWAQNRATIFAAIETIDRLMEENALAKELRTGVERLNQMLRDAGYGQGPIDCYVAQCEEVERLTAENARLKSRGIESMRFEIDRLRAKYKRLLEAASKAAASEEADAYCQAPGCQCSVCELYTAVFELTKEDEGSDELSRDQISWSDLLKLAVAAQEMIELGTTPPAPINKVQAGQTVAICHRCNGTGLHPTEAWSCPQCGGNGWLSLKHEGDKS